MRKYIRICIGVSSSNPSVEVIIKDIEEMLLEHPDVSAVIGVFEVEKGVAD